MDNLNPIEQKITYHIQRWHLGKNRATTFKNLSLALHVPQRELREQVAHLVSEHRQLIATTSDAGYYWIQDQSEYEHTRAELLSRIKKLAARLDGLDLGWREKNQGQQKLIFKKDSMKYY